MKKFVITILTIFCISNSFSQTNYHKEDLPEYYIQGSDTIGILLTIEQVQKLDNNSELLKLYEKLSIKCDSLDTYYVGVINKMNDKIQILEFKISKQKEAIDKQDDMVKDLNQQLSNRITKLDYCEQQRSNDAKIIEGLKKDLRKAKWKNIAGWLTTGLTSTLAIGLGIFFGTK